MARYTEDSIRAVKDAIDMLDLVGSRTELRRVSADSYSGRCPFHDERTPSFSVKPSDKLYYCFGCQAQGDAIRFVEQTEGFDFAGTVEYLADRYNVTLEHVEEDPREADRRRRRERLLELLGRACSYYERVLWDSEEGVPAREYLTGRGLEEASLRTFRVGFAPASSERMFAASRREGFTDAELLAAGLVRRSGDAPERIYASFRRRITFPLCDVRGQVLGFGARTLDPAEARKYLNSADGEIYHKGRRLFATHLARSAAARAGSTVLCEGYVDVIAAHQSGVANCVGLMGTALTDEQAAELRRLAPGVVLALDADGAGLGAMLKAAEVIEKHGLEVRVAALPPGEDPADVLRAGGAAAVQKVIGASLPLVRFRVERFLAADDRGTPEGRDRILGQLRPIFAALGPGAMREELEREVTSRLEVSEATVTHFLAGPSRTAAADPMAELAVAKLAAIERTERMFLELCIALPGYGEKLLADLDIETVFGSPLARAAAAHLRTHLEAPANGVADPALGALLAELAVRAASLAPVAAELEVERRQLELARIDRAIAGARGGDPSRLSDLGHERAALKRELDSWLDRVLLDQTDGAD